jgi:putative addiction module killer protein
MKSMNIFSKSDEFDNWLSSLKNSVAKARITQRIRSAQLGNFGDCKPVGEGVSEMRIHTGAGYRLYYTRTEFITYWLLIGGDKSTQKHDIEMAIKLSKQLKDKIND